MRADGHASRDGEVLPLDPGYLACLRPGLDHEPHANKVVSMALPLKPPVKPQLAKSAKDLPEGDKWRYEPKWDGFRTIVFRDGDDVHLQSRNGKPMNRYFPEVVPQILALPAKQLVLDGELVIEVDGVHEFDLLSQRIHPAKSRVDMLAEKTPAFFVAFDVLAEGKKQFLKLPYGERR